MWKMAKQSSAKKLKTWDCSKGCDVTKSICPHLEKHLPDVDKGALRLIKMIEMRDYDELTKQLGPEEPEARWLLLLQHAGLEPIEAAVILEMFINDLSERDVVKRLKFSYKDQVHRLKKHAMAKLRGNTEFKELLVKLKTEVKDA